jgi:RNA polymerase sigma-70 factor (ECF subfamily)
MGQSAKTKLYLVPSRPLLRGDDVRSFEALLGEHRAALEAVALRLARNRDDAQDLVQDTLERAWRARERFAAGTNVRAWLITILRHRFFDESRRRTGGPFGPQGEPADFDELPLREAEIEPAWASITSEQLRAAVSALPQPFRRICELRFFENLPYDVIARHLRIPGNTVGTRLLRARRKLRETLAQQEPLLRAG